MAAGKNKISLAHIIDRIIPLMLYNKISIVWVFKNRNLFPHTSENWKSKITVPAELISDEGSLPGL